MIIKKALFILLNFFSVLGFSQDISIYGTVKSENWEHLPGVIVSINDNIHTVTDSDGFYNIRTQNTDSFLLNLKLLGYKPIDTLVRVVEVKMNLNFKMHSRDVVLKEVEITAKGNSLFNKENRTILDYIIYNDLFIVLGNDMTDTYIYIFSLKGKLLSKTKTEKKYTKLFKSCIGGFHLVGNKEGREFAINEKTIFFKERYTIESFRKFLEPCQFKFDSHFIFKRLTHFNKRIVFYYYDRPNSEKIIHEVVNKEELQTATHDLTEILHLYYSTVAKKETDNTEIIKYDNLIKEGKWTGDLDQLDISDDLAFKIMWFKNISSAEINADAFIKNDKLYIIDYENSEVKEFSINSDLLSTKNLALKYKNARIIRDHKNENIFLICNNQDIYKVDTKEMYFSYVLKLNNEYYFPKNFQIYDDELYLISYDNVKSTYNKMNRIRF